MTRLDEEQCGLFSPLQWRHVLALLLILVPSVMLGVACTGKENSLICIGLVAAGMLLALMDE